VHRVTIVATTELIVAASRRTTQHPLDVAIEFVALAAAADLVVAADESVAGRRCVADQQVVVVAAVQRSLAPCVSSPTSDSPPP
jgi:hypothetical protein